MKPIERVLEHLQNIRTQGKGWTARCLAHEDNRNSLSISEGEDGRVLLHCHAGCEVKKIVEALGLSMTDLFPPRPEALPRITETYNYTLD